MTTFSEDVLLQIPNVKHKKGEGTLYVMSERIAFILQNSETVSVSHLYTDIKVQKISSEAKNKVQLQLVFHDNTTSTFQFVKPNRNEAICDRDKVKDILFKLLPKFQKRVNKELEEKNRMLSENPTLLQLYKDLVISHVITAEEFWLQHAPKYVVPSSAEIRQNFGVPGNFLNIKTQVGVNSIKYKLSDETIHCILKTFPAVRKKYSEYVPNKLSRDEFFTKFFESHYFHKDRIHMGNKDLFSECAKYDEQEFKKEIKNLNNDSLINLNSIDDGYKLEGYGISNEEFTKSNIVHECMIKRFNQHSIMVLKSSNPPEENVKLNLATNDKNIGKSLPNGTINIPTNNSSNKTNNKKIRIADNLIYDDLKTISELNDKSTNNEVFNLKLKNIEVTANDFPKSAKSETNSIKLGKANLIREQIIGDIEKWSKQNSTSPIHPSAAVNALGELTPGGSLMKNLSDNNKSMAHLIPVEITEELQNIYMALGELLRHFWACFPPTTQNLEEKAIHTHDALRRFHSAKLQPFEDRIFREHSQLNHISNHLNIMLNAAYDKFSSWHCRRKQH